MSYVLGTLIALLAGFFALLACIVLSWAELHCIGHVVALWPGRKIVAWEEKCGLGGKMWPGRSENVKKFSLNLSWSIIAARAPARASNLTNGWLSSIARSKVVPDLGCPPASVFSIWMEQLAGRLSRNILTANIINRYVRGRLYALSYHNCCCANNISCMSFVTYFQQSDCDLGCWT